MKPKLTTLFHVCTFMSCAIQLDCIRSNPAALFRCFPINLDKPSHIRHDVKKDDSLMARIIIYQEGTAVIMQRTSSIAV